MIKGGVATDTLRTANASDPVALLEPCKALAEEEQTRVLSLMTSLVDAYRALPEDHRLLHLVSLTAPLIEASLDALAQVHPTPSWP